jgi:hypothetical protein
MVRARSSKDPQDEKKGNNDGTANGRAGKVHADREKKCPRSMVSSDEPTVVKSALATRLATLTFGKRVPESEGLVPGACDDRLAVRAHREI